MDYEDGMQIIWDVITREVVVIFRGTVTALPGKFDSRQQGIEAGEEVCRNGGWGMLESVGALEFSIQQRQEGAT